MTEPDITARAREIAAGLTEAQRAVIMQSGRKVASGLHVAEDWIPLGDGKNAHRTMAVLERKGLVNYDGHLRSRTDLGRAVTAVLAETACSRCAGTGTVNVRGFRPCPKCKGAAVLAEGTVDRG